MYAHTCMFATNFPSRSVVRLHLPSMASTSDPKAAMGEERKTSNDLSSPASTSAARAAVSFWRCVETYMYTGEERWEEAERARDCKGGKGRQSK